MRIAPLFARKDGSHLTPAETEKTAQVVNEHSLVEAETDLSVSFLVCKDCGTIYTGYEHARSERCPV